ncbi:MAG: hypothetical protein M3P04_01360, partial [Actinomycetota bacterium]|nr:hypothetical protein [Actinomycetota bacterium]
AGNRSACSSSLTFLEDSAPPAMISGLGLPSGVTGVGTQPIVVGTAEPGSVVSFYALAPGGSTCVATPLLTASAADLLAGVRVPFVARATTARAVVVRDAAGNTSNPCGLASSISYTETSTETEPNNTAGTANLGATAVGVADQYGEVESYLSSDFYTVTVPALGSIRAETLAVPGGAQCKYSVPSSLNSKVRIRTTAGVILATNDDGGPGPCSLTMASLLSAGTYVVEVTSSVDAVAGHFPLAYHLVLTVADAPSGIMESEANNTLATADPLGSYTGTPIDVNASFGTTTDQDVFSFDLGSTTTLTFDAMDGSGSGSCVGVGIGLEVFDSVGTLVGSASPPAEGGCTTLSLSGLPADTYLVRTTDLLVPKTYGYHLRVHS